MALGVVSLEVFSMLFRRRQARRGGAAWYGRVRKGSLE